MARHGHGKALKGSLIALGRLAKPIVFGTPPTALVGLAVLCEVARAADDDQLFHGGRPRHLTQPRRHVVVLIAHGHPRREVLDHAESSTGSMTSAGGCLERKPLLSAGLAPRFQAPAPGLRFRS